jgi:hypothetical protein
VPDGLEPPLTQRDNSSEPCIEGVQHSYVNVGDTPARILFIYSPAGMERMLSEIGQPVQPGYPRRRTGPRTWPKWARSQTSATLSSCRRSPTEAEEFEPRAGITISTPAGFNVGALELELARWRRDRLVPVGQHAARCGSLPSTDDHHRQTTRPFRSAAAYSSSSTPRCPSAPAATQRPSAHAAPLVLHSARPAESLRGGNDAGHVGLAAAAIVSVVRRTTFAVGVLRSSGRFGQVGNTGKVDGSSSDPS